MVSVQGFVECLLCLVRRDVADGAMQAGVVIPVEPFQGFSFDLANGVPRAEELDPLGFEHMEGTVAPVGPRKPRNG